MNMNFFFKMIPLHLCRYKASIYGPGLRVEVVECCDLECCIENAGSWRHLRPAYARCALLIASALFVPQVEHDKRSRNHSELLEALKEVNQIIQKASRLRYGPTKTRIVAACRAAIKSKNMAALLRIVRDGEVPPNLVM